MTMKVIASTLIVAMLGLGGIASTQANETIFKWTDDDGVVHYAAYPPEDKDYVEVGVDVRSDPVSAQPEPDAAEAATAATRLPEPPDIDRIEPDPGLVAERCEQARSNLETLNRHANIVVSEDDGQQYALSREQRQQMITESQEFIAEWC